MNNHHQTVLLNPTKKWQRLPPQNYNDNDEEDDIGPISMPFKFKIGWINAEFKSHKHKFVTEAIKLLLQPCFLKV